MQLWEEKALIEEEAKIEGRIEGENRFAKLLQMLIAAGRNEDLNRAISDEAYREHLYRENHL